MATLGEMTDGDDLFFWIRPEAIHYRARIRQCEGRMETDGSLAHVASELVRFRLLRVYLIARCPITYDSDKNASDR